MSRHPVPYSQITLWTLHLDGDVQEPKTSEKNAIEALYDRVEKRCKLLDVEPQAFNSFRSSISHLQGKGKVNILKKDNHIHAVTLPLLDESELGSNPFENVEPGKALQSYSPEAASDALLGEMAHWPLPKRSALLSALSASIERSVQEMATKFT